jgi:hypothetical protein
VSVTKEILEEVAREAVEKAELVAKAVTTDDHVGDAIGYLSRATKAVSVAHENVRREEELSQAGEAFAGVSQSNLLCVRLNIPGNWALLSMFGPDLELKERVCLNKDKVRRLALLLSSLEERMTS